jgi:hypothetical protein
VPNKDITTLIASANARGLALDETDAGFVILAKKILSQASPEPSQAALAQEVLQEFAERLATGGPATIFAGFALIDNAEGSI